MQVKKSQIQPPKRSKLVLKTLAVLFLLGMLVEIMIFTIGFVAEERRGESAAEIMEWCDGYYYEKEYHELWHNLRLYDAYSPEFDKYWEMVNGYRAYMQYKQWMATPADKMPESVTMTEEYKKKVIKNAENCKFEENKKQLDAYAKEIVE